VRGDHIHGVPHCQVQQCPGPRSSRAVFPQPEGRSGVCGKIESRYQYIWLLEWGIYTAGGKKLTNYIYYWWSPAVSQTNWGECPDAGWGRPTDRKYLSEYVDPCHPLYDHMTAPLPRKRPQDRLQDIAPRSNRPGSGLQGAPPRLCGQGSSEDAAPLNAAKGLPRLRFAYPRYPASRLVAGPEYLLPPTSSGWSWPRGPPTIATTMRKQHDAGNAAVRPARRAV